MINNQAFSNNEVFKALLQICTTGAADQKTSYADYELLKTWRNNFGKPSRGPVVLAEKCRLRKRRIEIWLELETRCNLNCKFCYNYWKDGSSPAPRRLNTERTKEALEKVFSAIDCEKVAISGGEPLLHEDLPEILKLINAHNIPMVLTTNGTQLDSEKLRQLRDLGVVTIQIPLHSSHPAVHNYLSGGDCWAQSIRSLMEVRNSGLDIVPVFVATRLNADHFAGVLDICSHLDIRDVLFNRFVPAGLGIINQDLIGVPDDSMLLRVLTATKQVAQRSGIVVHLGMPLEIPESLRATLSHLTLSSCPISAGQTRFTIDAAANVRLCNQSGKAIGNILDPGTTVLDRMANAGADTSEDEFRQCQFLKHSKLIQIRAGETSTLLQTEGC